MVISTQSIWSSATCSAARGAAANWRSAASLTPWTVVSRDWRSWCGDLVAPAQRSIAGASCASDNSCPGFGEPGPATPLRASSQGLNATVAERAVRRPNADLDALFLLTCIHIPTRYRMLESIRLAPSPSPLMAQLATRSPVIKPVDGMLLDVLAAAQRRGPRTPASKASTSASVAPGYRRGIRTRCRPLACPRISVVKASAGTRLLRRTTDERARSRSDVVIRRFRLQGSRQLPAWNDAVVDLSPDPPSGSRQAEHLALHIIRRRGLIVLVMRATRFFDGKSGCELDRLLSFSTPPPRCG